MRNKVERRLIDLGKGHPSTSLLPISELAQATLKLVSQHQHSSNDSDNDSDNNDDNDIDRHPLQYGTDAGPRTTRIHLANLFTKRYALDTPIDPATLSLTCGASYGLSQIITRCCLRGFTRRIILVTPVYFLAANLFRDAGFSGDDLVAVGEGEEGCDVDALAAFLRRDSASLSSASLPVSDSVIVSDGIGTDEAKRDGIGETKRYRYLLYCVPTFGNPTGTTWTEQCRRKVLALAREYDILIVSDEVYDFLDYAPFPKTPIKRFVDLDLESSRTNLDPTLATLSDSDGDESTRCGNTISNMSFSKYLGPGLRVGAIQSSTPILAQHIASAGANHAGGATCQLNAFHISHFIESGLFDGIVNRISIVYKQREEAMRAAIERFLPLGTEIYGGAGGYFLWVGLPEVCLSHLPFADADHDDKRQIGMTDLLNVARSQFKVHVLPGSVFEVPGPGNQRGWDERWMRISFSWSHKEDCVEGIKRLGAAIDSLCFAPSSHPSLIKQ